MVHRFVSQRHEAPSREAMGKILSTLEARAIHDGKQHKVDIRVAGDLRTAVYLDMGGDDWQALKLTADGYELVGRPPVKFRRGTGMLPLPMPDKTGSIDMMREWFHCESDEDWRLMFAWIMTAMCPDTPYPILVLSGPPGSAKTTTSKMIRILVDPNTVPLSGVPKDIGDLIAYVQNSRVLGFDNLNRLAIWLSDVFCRLSTGEGIRARQFHTNAKEVLMRGGVPNNSKWHW